jgi:hypothetical protein
MGSEGSGGGRWVGPAIAVWGIAAAAGTVALLDHSSRPGTQGRLPQRWPADVALARDPERFTLLMFVHPQCPCTAASVAELARLLARTRAQIDAFVLLHRPAAAPAGWTETRTALAAAAVPGVRTHVDADGALARRFGAETSGQVLVYDRANRLRFAGGITSARGHEGDSAGRAAIEALAADGGAGTDAAVTTTPVFGCELFEAGDAACPPERSGR